MNKPSGVTSHDVVAKARRVLQTRAVGHCGTLDPLAEGLLILVVGEATKMSQFLLEGDKSYELEMTLGLTTDTLDITGQTLSEDSSPVDDQKIQSVMENFIGEKNWPVPLYSAVKVQGQKLYEYGRQGEQVERPVKLMKFWNLEFQERNQQKVRFHIHCSKGSYIRTWVHEFGQSLGCGAALSYLKRTSSTPFQLQQAQTLESIESDLVQKKQPSSFLTLTEAWNRDQIIKVKGLDEKLMKNGQIGHELKLRLIQKFNPDSLSTPFLIQSSRTLQPLALVSFEAERGFVTRRVFNF